MKMQFIGALICALPTIGYAQSCVSVYKDAVRDVNVTTQERSSKSFYFNMYCEKSGETKTLTTSASFTLPIKGVPVEFSGDGNWDEKEWKDFCKTGSEQKFYESSDFSFGSVVVSDALASFNECVALEQKNLLVTHHLTPPIGVSISGTIKSQNPVRILGLLHQEDLITCTSNSFTEDGSQEDIGLGRAISGIEENFVISCLRKPQKSNGTEFYPSTALTLGTSEGNYTVRLRNDKLLNFDLASEAQAAFDTALADRNAALQSRDQAVAEQNRLKNTLSNASVDTWIIHAGDGNGFPSGHNGHVHNHDSRPNWDSKRYKDVSCGTKVDVALAQKICGKRRAIGPFGVLDVGGGICGHALYYVSCLVH
ncbi:hypothetical protein [Actibacterium lipolyticum]|uniref:SCP domain-containing protein n=1 Tax=Actibacterium lipolyticum TaxID=1524263 RepID=A0A238JQ22_9RHOB|nr:hypothetical protein [Actibacterium lipolyticum]SMX31952.1 hypothetical protein COL8621_00662 [Actibacterium lipolyticum]